MGDSTRAQRRERREAVANGACEGGSKVPALDTSEGARAVADPRGFMAVFVGAFGVPFWGTLVGAFTGAGAVS